MYFLLVLNVATKIACCILIVGLMPQARFLCVGIFSLVKNGLDARLGRLNPVSVGRARSETAVWLAKVGVGHGLITTSRCATAYLSVYLHREW